MHERIDEHESRIKYGFIPETSVPSNIQFHKLLSPPQLPIHKYMYAYTCTLDKRSHIWQYMKAYTISCIQTTERIQ